MQCGQKSQQREGSAVTLQLLGLRLQPASHPVGVTGGGASGALPDESPAPESPSAGPLRGLPPTQAPNPSLCTGPPPRVHALPRGPSGSPRPPCWLRSSTRTISFRKALGAVSRMLCTVLRRVAQASSWKQRTTLAVGRLSAGGGCCRHLRGGEAGCEGKGSPSRGGSSQWFSSQLVGSLPGLSQNLH